MNTYINIVNIVLINCNIFNNYFLKIIYNLRDEELGFYLSCLKTIFENSKLIKN